MTTPPPSPTPLWSQCMTHLEAELPQEDVHAWLKPLQARVQGQNLYLFAPNAFVLEEVRERHLSRIRELAGHIGAVHDVLLSVGSPPQSSPSPTEKVTSPSPVSPALSTPSTPNNSTFQSNLNPDFKFDNFVEGRSNQMALAAAWQAAQNPGSRQNNPLLLYGGTGLGKTHLMLAAGNEILRRNPKAQVLYLRSDRFFQEFVDALKKQTTDQFKRRFQDIDTLLIDDIQFFAGKGRSQEEFFHIFNALFDGRQQIILTCDLYPREVEGLEPRLRSRLTSGLAVAIEPPDFETRALIVLSKARERGADVPEDVAMMLAKRMTSNVRELEGAINMLTANANLLRQPITKEFANETLRDLFRAQQSVISITAIQKAVADYYSIQQRDLASKSRTNSITRPRHMAILLCRELTDHSLSEIGEAFGGRDHSTVLNGCRKMRELIESNAKFHADWEKLVRKLTE